MIFVNFKTYKEGTGAEALRLVKILEEVSHQSQIKIIPVVQATDVKEIISASALEIWVQHIDPIEQGPFTGYILPEAVVEDGAFGTFLNHSEHRFENFQDLTKAVERASGVGLKTCVFARDLKEAEKICGLKPTFIAYEPPELIGSKETSVAKKKPDVISRAVQITKIHEIPLIVGAGIKSKEDVRKSLELGAVGVAVSSDVVISQDPRREINDLVLGFLG